MAIIGRATVRSAPGIARVYIDSWRAAYAGILPDRVLLSMSVDRQTAEWTWLIRNRAQTQPVMIAAEVGHGVVGVSSVGPCRSSDRPAAGLFARQGDGDATGEVFTLYVGPDYQELGIGRQLLSAAFTALSDCGYARGLLWVLRDNPARFFYERMGGQKVAERRERLWESDVDKIAYGWPDLKGAIARIGSCSAT